MKKIYNAFRLMLPVCAILMLSSCGGSGAKVVQKVVKPVVSKTSKYLDDVSPCVDDVCKYGPDVAQGVIKYCEESEPTICENCNGNGYGYYEDYYGNVQIVECPVCNGTGKY